jgi:glycosyltransferase involved in cell wall biosynthesis
MSALSVVIITRNEEHHIVDCIQSAKLVSDNIIVVDTGSSDNTVMRAAQSGAQVFSINWEGYGASRNFGARKAKNNWILALDADERISKELALSISNLPLADAHCVYRFQRRNYLGQQEIQFGTLGFETVKRIYNRKYAEWDLTLVHEKLKSNHYTIKKRISGSVVHYGLKSKADYKAKAVVYAQMSAEKYFLQGKKSNLLKRFLSPAFNSVKSYIFQLGFLDGRQGLAIAKIIAYYSWLKYFYLHRLVKEAKHTDLNFSPRTRMESIQYFFRKEIIK